MYRVHSWSQALTLIKTGVNATVVMRQLAPGCSQCTKCIISNHPNTSLPSLCPTGWASVSSRRRICWFWPGFSWRVSQNSPTGSKTEWRTQRGRAWGKTPLGWDLHSRTAEALLPPRCPAWEPVRPGTVSRLETRHPAWRHGHGHCHCCCCCHQHACCWKGHVHTADFIPLELGRFSYLWSTSVEISEARNVIRLTVCLALLELLRASESCEWSKCTKEMQSTGHLHLSELLETATLP